MKILDETPQTNGSEPTRNDPARKIIPVLIAILILGGVFYLANKYRNTEKPSSDYTLQEIAKLEAEKQKKVLEDLLAEYQKSVEDLSADADVSARYLAYTRLADIQIRLGRYQEALASLENLPEERKDNGTVLALFARSYQGIGDSTKAKDNIQKALVTDDDIPENWLLYFSIFTDLSNEELDAKYREALTKTNNNIEIVKSYARFLEKIGDISKAVIYWETARNVDPEHAADYEKEIARLRPPQ